jgi:hypothetical protein
MCLLLVGQVEESSTNFNLSLFIIPVFAIFFYILQTSCYRTGILATFPHLIHILDHFPISVDDILKNRVRVSFSLKGI